MAKPEEINLISDLIVREHLLLLLVGGGVQLRFRAVDEEAEPSPYESSENEETKCLELYKEALGLQSTGDMRAAKLRYKQLLRSPFLAAINSSAPTVRCHSRLSRLCARVRNQFDMCTCLTPGAPQQTQSQSQSTNTAALKLRYLCLKNLADVNDAQGNANAALKYYIQVLPSYTYGSIRRTA
jgi:hypothetical protein